MGIIDAALKKEKLKLQADTLPKEQRTVKVFQRLIAAMRATEAEVEERLSNAQRDLNVALQGNLELHERVRQLENQLLHQRLKERVTGIDAITAKDRLDLLECAGFPATSV